MSTSRNAILVSVSVGIVIGSLVTRLLVAINSKDKKNNSTPDDNSSDDNFQSLFYSKTNDEQHRSGCGFPCVKSIDTMTKQGLLTVQPEYKRLDIALYKAVVENMVVTCIDVVLQRKIDNKLLLFYRRDKPAKGIWWWPGGRMFRGETFENAAVRKITDETGITDSKTIIPIAIIDCWNTFFPDSNWDEGRKSGYEGTQTVNITIFCKYIGDDNMDSKMNEKSKAEFAVEQAKWVTVKEGKSNKYDKYVRLNIEKAIKKSYLYE